MNTNALIRTKLQQPAIGPDILPRPQLIERLENGRYRKLTLISAPAGYGKSILAGIWARECACSVAWISLDSKDNELGVFTSYLVHAIQTIFPDSFPETEELLSGQQLPSLDILSTRLINEALLIAQPFMIILDDYHVITSQAINRLISALIKYLPANMHLVLITRQDPPLDIINLRARNQLAEIRLADLRFSAAEAQQYLENELNDPQAPDVARQIFERTEGWAAGLRLTLLAIRNQRDQAHFLEGLQRSNQYVMTYLLNEVLAQQPPAIQTFLLQTSLLDRFSAPLCDALLLIEDTPENLFKSFENKPFAAASIAQVHRATLHDGTPVAVKIQRPNIDVAVKADLNVINDLTRSVQKKQEWARTMDLYGLVDEFGKSILFELDYRNEASNVSLLARNMVDFETIHVPTVYADLTTSKVLVMEYMPGVKINDIERIEAAGWDRRELARDFVQAMIKQALFDGFFHADPHPGNVLVNLETGQIGFLDMGLMGEMNRMQRMALGDALGLNPDSSWTAILIITLGLAGILGQYAIYLRELKEGQTEPEPHTSSIAYFQDLELDV